MPPMGMNGPPNGMMGMGPPPGMMGNGGPDQEMMMQ